MQAIKKKLKNMPLIYYIYNMRNGFWKKGLFVKFEKFNVRLKGIHVKNKGSNNSLFIGAGTTLNDCTIHISGDNNKIYIGSKCSLCGVHFYAEDNNNEIYLGNGTTTTDEVDLSTIEGTNLQIGSECMISKKVYISTGDGHSICNITDGKRTNKSKNVVIGDRVWIGTRVIIGKGVELGSDTIVAAGSVCTSSVEKHDNVVVAGNPAKIVKRNVKWKRERVVL